jgi:hypothetical protein
LLVAEVELLETQVKVAGVEAEAFVNFQAQKLKEDLQDLSL